MKAYIEKYGVKYSIETEHDEEDAFEFTRNIYNLILCMGFHKDNIIESLKDIIESEQIVNKL